MQVQFVEICMLFLLVASANSTENPKSSLFGFLLSGFRYVKDFFVPRYVLKEGDLHFFLYGRQKGLRNDLRSTISDFAKKGGKLFFIIHGYMSGRNHTWYKDLTLGILYRYPDSLVAQVSWENLSSTWYPVSTRYTEEIGKKLAHIIHTLENHYRIPADRYVLIGHSLGAQICGWTGRIFEWNTGRKLPRIIALDPAQPLFKGIPRSKRLSANDAKVVIVVHTDGFLGFVEPCGSLDFYVNGGFAQKRCANMTSLIKRSICDHTSSQRYLIQALTKPMSYIGRRCLNLDQCQAGHVLWRDWVSMGDLELGRTGLFHVDTPD